MTSHAVGGYVLDLIFTAIRVNNHKLHTQSNIYLHVSVYNFCKSEIFLIFKLILLINEGARVECGVGRTRARAQGTYSLGVVCGNAQHNVC
jgi:hypothetical protein